MADKTYNMTLTLSDGSTINAGSFVAPQGAQGDTATGPTGASGIGWEHGITNPSSTVTSDMVGTLYLNTATGELWVADTGLSWLALGTLKGDTGSTGASGVSVTGASLTEVS